MRHWLPNFRQLLCEFATRGGVVATIIAAGLGAVSWLVWLPWHAPTHLSTSGIQSGPYTTDEVTALIVSVGVLSLLGGWLRLAGPVAFGLSVGLAVAFSANAATTPTTPPSDANLWPIGAVMLLLAAIAGLSAVALTGLAIRTFVSFRRQRRDSPNEAACQYTSSTSRPRRSHRPRIPISKQERGR